MPALAELPLERRDELETLWRQDSGLVRREDGDAGGGRAGAHAVGADSNCSSSVEPVSASVELSPPVTAPSTASK